MRKRIALEKSLEFVILRLARGIHVERNLLKIRKIDSRLPACPAYWQALGGNDE